MEHENSSQQGLDHGNQNSQQPKGYQGSQKAEDLQKNFSAESTATKKNDSFSKNSAEFRGKATDLGHDFQKLGTLTKNLAGDSFRMLGENASEYYDQGMKEVKNFEKNVEGKIQEKPLRYLFIAAGVGLLAGFFLRKR